MKVTNTKQVKNLFAWLHGVTSKDASRPVLGESLLMGYSNENDMYPPGKYIGVLMGMRKESDYDLMSGFEEYV